MSTLVYGSLTTRRVAAMKDTSVSPPDVSSYVDMVAALVPAEVLALHGVILALTTSVQQDQTGSATTLITEPNVLYWSFFGLLGLSVVLYAAARFRKKKEGLDLVRGLIPPCAFVAWTMLQRAMAFDAVRPELGEVPRTVIGLFAAVVLATLAKLLAPKDDRDKRPKVAKSHP